MSLPKVKFDYDLIFFIIFSLIYKKGNFLLYFLAYFYIFIHEMCHILVAFLFKINTKKINFTLCGCNAELDDSIFNFDARKDLLIKLAGPMFNFIMCIFSYNKQIFYINFSLFIINLLPIIPLDGFYILKDILDIIIKDCKKSNKIIIFINNISIIAIFILGIFFCIKYCNFSLLLFIVYVTIINMQIKTNYRILNKIKEII